MAIDNTGAFIQAASEPPPHPSFTKILGGMLVDFDVITPKQFDLVGEIQARTVVLAGLSEYGTPEQQEAILARYEGRNRDGSMTGEVDFNGAMFGMHEDTAVAELDELIQSLGLADADSMIAKALEGNKAGKGVTPKAAHAKPIINGLFFADYEKAEKQNLSDGALTMQHTMRAMQRVEMFLAGAYNRQSALELAQTSSNIVYKFDPAPLRQANEALLYLCSVEMAADSALQDGVHIDEIREESEYAVYKRIGTLINAMQAGNQMFKDGGRDDLGVKASEVHEYFATRYAGLKNVPHVMMAPKAQSGFEDFENDGGMH